MHWFEYEMYPHSFMGFNDWLPACGAVLEGYQIPLGSRALLDEMNWVTGTGFGIIY